MDNLANQITQLLDEGRHFTFENFSTRADGPRGKTDLTYGGEDTPEWQIWTARTSRLILENFVQGSGPVKSITSASAVRTQGNYKTEFDRKFSLLMTSLMLAKKSCEADVFGEKLQRATTSNKMVSNKVFIVHGHDNALKDELAAFVHTIGLEPIILHRQPDLGDTVIEKIEANNDVGYAFILMTPDDLAFGASAKEVPPRDSMEKRARPNVIFEFGYFCGLLGRKHVCCLLKGDVTVPSDLSGLVYKRVNPNIESIAYAIIKELKSLGFTLTI